MLILTRKLGENIRIGDKIKIIILDVKGGQVKLGIEAPLNVAVHREEIYVLVREENRKRLAAEAAAKQLEDVAKIFNRGKDRPASSKAETVPSPVLSDSAPSKKRKLFPLR